MVKISDNDYAICAKYGLLFDGKHKRRGLNWSVMRNADLGRTFVRTKHNIYITEGSSGISKQLEYFRKKENSGAC